MAVFEIKEPYLVRYSDFSYSESLEYVKNCFNRYLSKPLPDNIITMSESEIEDYFETYSLQPLCLFKNEKPKRLQDITIKQALNLYFAHQLGELVILWDDGGECLIDHEISRFFMGLLEVKIYSPSLVWC
jgi:hypothetical protein